MKFNQLQLTARKSRRRSGRGIAAGRGKTAGRGTKGQKSRSGGRTRPFFEGGQTPLVRRLPKLAGFTSHRPAAQVIYTGQLDALASRFKIIDNHALKMAGLIKDPYRVVKVIVKGDLKKSHQLELQKISQAAQAQLKAAGGQFTRIPVPKRPASEKKAGRKAARAADLPKKKLKPGS